MSREPIRRSHLDDVVTISVKYRDRIIDAAGSATPDVTVPSPPTPDDESVWFVVL